MAFGVAATVLDNFNRTSGAIGANWSRFGGFNSDFVIVSDTVVQGIGAAANGNYWNAASFGPDVEAYVTVSTKGAGAEDDIRVGVRYDGAGSRTNYELIVTPVVAGTDNWQIFRIVAGAATEIVSGTLEIASGGKIGLEAIGTQISAYYHAGVSWAQVLTVSDSAISGSGRVGFMSISNSHFLDDFAAGTITSSAGSTSQNLLLLGVG